MVLCAIKSTSGRKEPMIKVRVLALSASLLSVCPTAGAAVYKCTDAATGKSAYQEQPCADAKQGGQVQLRDGNWERIESTRPVESYATGQFDTYIDTAYSRRLGKFTVAKFKQAASSKYGIYAEIVYLAYDCSGRRITRRPDTDPALPHGTDMVPYERFHTEQMLAGYPFAEPRIVAKVCGS